MIVKIMLRCVDCDVECSGTRCKRCANAFKNKAKSLRHNIDLTTLTIDRDSFTASDASGCRIPVKMKFSVPCLACGNAYVASLIFERSKKHPWHCKACAISLEWTSSSYREKHVEELKKANSLPSARERRSIQSKLNWRDPVIREAMMRNRDRNSAAAKGKATRIANLLSGKSSYRVTHGKRVLVGTIWMRSTYEARFANFLDTLDVEWSYEPKHFSVLNGAKTYLPDFYVPNIDAFIEIKGWWRDDAREKFDDFVRSYPLVRYALIDKHILESLERGEVSLEACVVPSRG